MTENDNIDFARGDEPGRGQLTADLATAMHQQADRFEPRADSFLRLQQAVDGAPAPSNVMPLQPGRRIPRRYFAVAALLCVTVGGLGFLFAGSRPTEIQTVPADSTTTPITTTTVPVTSTAPEEDEASGELPAGDDDSTESVDDGLIDGSAELLLAGPRRSTREAAVRDFMALIRLSFARIEFEGGIAVVYGFDPEGNVGQAVSELTLTPVRLADGTDGFAVTRADSPSAAIESPAPGTLIDGQTVTVTGSGEGFEAGLGVRVYSSFDGLLFDAVGATGGNFGQVAPYSADVTVTGREVGWVVVQSATGADVTAPFSAVPIEWDAGPDSSTYTVSFIRPDDADGGLNLRSLPALGEAVVEILPVGSTVQRRGEVPALVGTQVWWSVTTNDGVDGWVNSRFLARDGNVSDETLELIADQFLNEFVTFDGQFAGFLPWSGTKPVKMGWGPEMTNVDPAALRGSAFWADQHEWAVPAAAFGESILTQRFAELIRVDSFDDGVSAFSIEPRSAGDAVSSPYPVVAEALDSQFAGLASVHVAPVTAQTGDDSIPSFTLYVEPGPGGPTIVGVAVDFWIP